MLIDRFTQRLLTPAVRLGVVCVASILLVVTRSASAASDSPSRPPVGGERPVKMTPVADVQHDNAVADSIKQLQQFVTDVSSGRGQFAQYTVGPQGLTKPKQTGEFMFQRPGRFVWHVQQPYEQRVLSDGSTLFQYDPDLNQVMTRSVGQAIGSSPAAILFGSVKMDQAFNLQALPDQNGLSWLRATPKASDAGFVYIDIGFLRATPAQFVLRDGFGQTTHVELTNLQTNPQLAADTFIFVAPKGVDVVRSQ